MTEPATKTACRPNISISHQEISMELTWPEMRIRDLALFHLLYPRGRCRKGTGTKSNRRSRKIRPKGHETKFRDEKDHPPVGAKKRKWSRTVTFAKWKAGRGGSRTQSRKGRKRGKPERKKEGKRNASEGERRVKVTLDESGRNPQYTGCSRNRAAPGKEMIARVKVSGKYRIQFFHVEHRFRENRV